MRRRCKICKLSEIASSCLFNFDRFEQALEVSSAKALVVMSLNDFEEKGRSVLNWFGEYLKKIAFVVIVNQNLKFLEGCNIFLYLDASMLKAFSEPLIISIGDGQEFDTSVLKSCHCLDNIGSGESNMLDSSSPVIIDIFLDLRLSLSIGGLIDRHLNFLVKISDDNRSKRRVFSVNDAIIDRPESVEVKHLLIPLGDTLHLKVRLISNTVINF